MLRKTISKLLEGVDLDKEKKSFDELLQQVKRGVVSTGKHLQEEIDGYVAESKFCAEMLLLGKTKRDMEARHPGLSVLICFEKLGVKSQKGHIEHTFRQGKGLMTFTDLKSARRAIAAIGDAL